MDAYKGKLLSEMTKDELIEVVKELCKYYEYRLNKTLNNYKSKISEK